jgi:hypothetical protein
VVAGHGPTRDVDWLVGPLALAVLTGLSAALVSTRLQLLSGARS